MLKLQQLSRAVQQKQSLDLSSHFQNYACVSLILRWNQNRLELAFIRRAENPLDAWGGHHAFPGGRNSPDDTTDQDTAIRETREEVGYLLDPNSCVGRLDDVQARQRLGALPFFLRSFVFFITHDQKTKLDSTEVADFFWLPLEYLLDPKNHTTVSTKVADSVSIELPAIHFPRGPVLWGLTYIILTDFVERLRTSSIQLGTLTFDLATDLNFWRKYPPLTME